MLALLPAVCCVARKNPHPDPLPHRGRESNNAAGTLFRKSHGGRSEEFAIVSPDLLFPGPAQQYLCSAVYRGDSASQSEGHNRIVGALKKLPVPFFALPSASSSLISCAFVFR